MELNEALENFKNTLLKELKIEQILNWLEKKLGGK